MKVYHFHNGTGGGVLSVIKNLIEHSRNPEIENHIIYTINKEKIPKYEVPTIKGAESVQVFYYSPKWNFWHTCRQLAKLIPDGKAVLVAHDWLELGMASHLGLQNPIVQFLHGNYDYYYQLAVKHQQAVNIFGCVSQVIAENLKKHLPEREMDIFHCPFPVPEIICNGKAEAANLRIIFCVRDLNDASKQFQLLPQINQILLQKEVEVNWTIIGKGKSEKEIKKLLGAATKYFPLLANEGVQKEMCNNDVLIHPSLIEGFPVVVVEGMKAGLVPVINNWNGSTAELVIEGETGFYFKPGDADGYAGEIAFLSENPEILDQISARAKEKAEMLFDPFRNTEGIEAVYKQAAGEKRIKKAEQIYGSRLDKRWLPNGVVRALRVSK